MKHPNYHVVEEKLSIGFMELLPLCSTNHTIDLFTKSLAAQPFIHLINPILLDISNTNNS